MIGEKIWEGRTGAVYTRSGSDYGGFVRNDLAEPKEDRGFEILENITRELYSGFLDATRNFLQEGLSAMRVHLITEWRMYTGKISRC